MEEYFKTTMDRLHKHNFVNLTLVMGNESCDLDSAVSSLVFAIFLKWQHDKIKCKVCTKDKRDEANYVDDLFISVLDVDRKDYNLKTEVAYCFNEHGIFANNLVFRDDINLHILVTSYKTNVVLVDHHVLTRQHEYLVPYVTEVIDHRPIDMTSWKFKPDARCSVATAGSCATLVAQRVRELALLVARDADFLAEFPVCADLLHSTIILDTVNFSKELGKTTPQDVEIVNYLETIIKPDNCEEHRKAKLEKLVEARRDVSSLTSDQLLRRDTKQVANILVPGLPMLVEEFVKKPDALSAVSEALAQTNCNLALVLGMNLSGKLERDAAIYSEQKDLAERLSRFLRNWATPSLQLSPVALPLGISFRYFRQNNLAASRKQYVQALNVFLKNV